ncbi:hypothetical protein Tco_0681040 [Tanacetum coccineum]|uniref:Retrotransposon protein, putative, unclassified n=1 Tax=Tanacetum coccineum TaxID=301880 RepID=A0ABQ4XN14_9ASTR
MNEKLAFGNGNLRKRFLKVLRRHLHKPISNRPLESQRNMALNLVDPMDPPWWRNPELYEEKKDKAVDLLGLRKALNAVKRIFRYLKGTVHRGLWYLKDSSFALTAFADVDDAGCHDTRHNTSGSTQLLGDRLSFGCDYNLPTMALDSNKFNVPHDNKSAIALCCNNVQHSRSKHIDIRFHFIKEHVENGVIELYFVNTEYQLADIFTKALGRERIEFLINKLGMRSFAPETLKKLAD